MGLYQHIREAWKKPADSELWKERLMQWRTEPVTVRLEHPTRLDRARSLGYKAKQGFIVVRHRVIRGGHRRPSFAGGRRPSTFHKHLTLHQSYQHIAEVRVQRDFPNLVVLNSYWVGEDGRHRWYEVILVDPDHPVIKSDASLQWLSEKKHRSRVFHGKTSASRKFRGLQQQGKGVEKARPSRRANDRRL